MGQLQENLIQEFCDLWGDGSLEKKPQVEKILSMMSDDAEWQLWIPGGPVFRGKAELKAEILRQMGYATNNKCNIINIVSNDHIVMTERSDWAVIRGKPCPHSMVAVYELDENNLIKRWREYIDMADLMKKQGVDVMTVGQAAAG